MAFHPSLCDKGAPETKNDPSHRGVSRCLPGCPKFSARKAEGLKELDLMMRLTANLQDVWTQTIVVPSNGVRPSFDLRLAASRVKRRLDLDTTNPIFSAIFVAFVVKDAVTARYGD